MDEVWKDKVATGFTNYGSISGDKFSTSCLFAYTSYAAWHDLGRYRTILPSSQKGPLLGEMLIGWADLLGLLRNLQMMLLLKKLLIRAI